MRECSPTFLSMPSEITASGDQLFQPIGGFYDELVPSAEGLAAEPAAASNSASTGASAGAATRKAPAKKTHLTAGEERGSALQKIAKLDIKGRIQLAMKGSKEERSLLIRDGTKIVALAVLESPKVSDGEVERFASQKNVLEAVLRGIPMKRRFAKNYLIIRNLVFNPRTPLDLSLGLMKNMLVSDLRNLSNNKEVSDTVRKLATKMFKQKMDSQRQALSRIESVSCLQPGRLAHGEAGSTGLRTSPGTTIHTWLHCLIRIRLATCSSDPEPSQWLGSQTVLCVPATECLPTCRRRATGSFR